MTLNTVTPTRPPLRYHGGKFRIAPWIISHFPPHQLYCEPYGGGASVLLRKPPSYIEVYNDLNHEIVTFFRVLRERPAELIQAIELTPHSRAEFTSCQEPADDELEQARRIYVCAWQGRGHGGCPLHQSGGWRYTRTKARAYTVTQEWNLHPNYLYATAVRLRHVQLECDDALRIIRRYDTPNTLFYIDPPYLPETRQKYHPYKHDYTEDDHRTLAQLLHQIQGMAILSGYPANLYTELYPDWQCADQKTRNDNARQAITERLWLSPTASQALQRPTQKDFYP